MPEFRPTSAYWASVIIASCLLSLPALVFNGPRWYPYLFLFKWTVAFGVLAYVFGWFIFAYVTDRYGIVLTTLDFAWLTFALLLTLQPLVIPVCSIHEWSRNWFFFASMGASIFVLHNMPIDRGLPVILRGISIAGVLSAVFGFVQVSRWNGRIPFILDTSMHPGRFVGNTGLDNLLGAYLALAVLAELWLLLYRQKKDSGKTAKTGFSMIFSLFLIVINTIGIWRAASRSAFLACILGAVVLFCSFRPDVKLLRKAAVALTLLMFSFIALVWFTPDIFSVARRDMTGLFSAETLSVQKEGRFAIWCISLEMIRTAPILGVGLGNYKWNYMDAMASYRDKAQLSPRYTYWAHNEYLQWLAETGAVGTVILLGILLCALRLCLKRGQDDPFIVRPWVLASLTALMVDSCFSRPFHHADTAFMLPFALALISRLNPQPLTLVRRFRILFGGTALAVTAVGIILFVQMYSNQAYFGEYFYNKFSFSLSPSKERESVWQPFFLRDAALTLTARENYVRTGFDDDKEQNQRDAIRLLERCFAEQPRYDELNKLMLLYQLRGETISGERYLKYYPPEERQKFLESRFDGSYMEDSD